MSYTNHHPHIERAEFRHSDMSMRLMGLVGLNNFAGYDSSSRITMMTSHMNQALTPCGATVRRTISGMERKFGEHTRSIRMPCKARIVKVINRFNKTLGPMGDLQNPLTTIIYENMEKPNRPTGVIHLPVYHSIHQNFGFRYVLNTPVASRIYPGAEINAGEIIADSPSKIPNQSGSFDYAFGVGANIALMSLPGVIEDGVIVRRGFLNRLVTKGYGVKVMSYGVRGIPLNLYGGPGEYKIHPDVGERIRPDGLLFATRNHPGDSLMAVARLSDKALRNPDIFDDLVYVPQPGARVLDVQVMSGNKDKTPLPLGVENQTVAYYSKMCEYYKHILEVYQQLERSAKHTGGFIVEPEFENLVVEALKYIEGAKQKVKPKYCGSDLDKWRVTITYEYDIYPNIGFKITDLHGGKAVIVKIMEDADMPVDAEGKICDIIMDGDSTIKRMNIGRLIEPYINACSFSVSRRIREMLGTTPTPEQYDYAWSYLMGYYRMVSPPHHDAILTSGISPVSHLNSIVRDGIYLYLPTDNPVWYHKVARAIEDTRAMGELGYAPCYGPVRYTDARGLSIMTKMPVLIGEIYIILLEKTGNMWSALGSGKSTPEGIPARMSSRDRGSTPGRRSAVRITGEAEVRSAEAYTYPGVTADLIDQTNNPVVHRAICMNILESETPSNILEVIDRNQYPQGNGRILMLQRNMTESAGFKFAYGDGK